jgi:hypothetical protein
MGFVYGLVKCCQMGWLFAVLDMDENVCCLELGWWDGLLEACEGRRKCRVFKVQDS